MGKLSICSGFLTIIGFCLLFVEGHGKGLAEFCILLSGVLSIALGFSSNE